MKIIMDNTVLYDDETIRRQKLKRLIINCIVAFIIGFVLGTLLIRTVHAYEYTPSEIVQIGKVVQHEAGNQSELGKRLVVDTILNRVESADFPNTVADVLGQSGQYCNPSEYPPKDIYGIIAQEIYVRTDTRVLWYRTKQYHKYGVPIVKEGNHYFSGK